MQLIVIAGEVTWWEARIKWLQDVRMYLESMRASAGDRPGSRRGQAPTRLMDAVLSLRGVSLSFPRGRRHVVQVLADVSLDLRAGRSRDGARPARAGQDLAAARRGGDGAPRPGQRAVRGRGRVAPVRPAALATAARADRAGRARRAACSTCRCSRASPCRCSTRMVGATPMRAPSRGTRPCRRATECARQHWSELADSERALVALAHGIAREPRLLLVDDLTATLGIGERAEIAELLGALAVERGIAVLVCAGDCGPSASLPTGSPRSAEAELWCHRPTPEPEPGERHRLPGRASDGARPPRSSARCLMLELRDLVKHYHVGDAEPVRAVDGVSLSVAAGELVALYGPSGSGKTTLLMLIAALIGPDSGAVLVDGRDISTLSDAERSRYRLRELGFVDQTSDLLPGANVVQNAAMKLWLLEHAREAEQQDRAAARTPGAGRSTRPPRRSALDGRAPARDDRACPLDRAEARARRRADGQSRHPAQPRSPGAAGGGLPRARHGGAARHP